MSVRKSPDVKALNGNPGNRALSTNGKSATGTPQPPADLRGEAFAEWCRVTDFLQRTGHIEKIDHAALVVYCSAWGMFDAARKQFEEYGPLTVGRDGGFVKNPAAQIMTDASKIMAQYGAKFGFTPRDRVTLGMTSGEDESSIEDALNGL